ncbi:DUF4376 domain-containing protein [Vibrio europaeus]|uniref:DUF4376 domain-containing protein n=1 Tax=Vibrio europaeus TaxID=300876 RepID=UPI00148BAA61|nr:DUF4376 domain-containing protein [Vibrio europaeus]NOH26500.1 DUF4376 domain-containing protein [Vibrio europaeus]
MKYWTINQETKEVIGSGDADKWNVPRNVLTIEPLPCREKFAVIALDCLTGTEYIEDHRDELIFNTSTKECLLMKTLGAIPDGFTLIEPLPFSIWVTDKWVQQVNLVRTEKITEIKRWRDMQEADELQKVTVDGKVWDSGPSARVRIDSTLMTGLMPPYWTDANNVDHKGMTLEELTQVKFAISELGFAIHHRQRNMKKEVEALTDFDEILNYPVGWPQS